MGPALVYLSFCTQSRTVKVVPNAPWEYVAINFLVASLYTVNGAAVVPETAVNWAGSAGGCPSAVGPCFSADAEQRRRVAINFIMKCSTGNVKVLGGRTPW
jgi:hypothetical protein